MCEDGPTNRRTHTFWCVRPTQTLRRTRGGVKLFENSSQPLVPPKAAGVSVKVAICKTFSVSRCENDHMEDEGRWRKKRWERFLLHEFVFTVLSPSTLCLMWFHADEDLKLLNSKRSCATTDTAGLIHGTIWEEHEDLEEERLSLAHKRDVCRKTWKRSHAEMNTERRRFLQVWVTASYAQESFEEHRLKDLTKVPQGLTENMKASDMRKLRDRATSEEVLTFVEAEQTVKSVKQSWKQVEQRSLPSSEVKFVQHPPC